MTDGDLIEGARPWVDDAPDHGDSARVYPLVSDPGNRKRLVEWLDELDAYDVVRGTPPFEEATFDLCIVDEKGLGTHIDALKRRKEREAPVVLPYLLLLPAAEPESLTTNEGRIADTLLTSTIDDILSMPVRQAELRWRIEALLRLRSRTEELVERKREFRQFKRAVDAAGHAIYITDTEGKITYVNPAFEETTGYTREEAVGEPPKILDSGEMSEAYYDRLWGTILSGNVWSEEIVNERKSGGLYSAEQTISPVPDVTGDIGGFVAIQTDITEQKTLRTQSHEYRQAIESSPELLAAFDTQSRFLFANDRYREYYGIHAANLRRRPLEDVLTDEVVERVEPSLNRARDGETVRFETTHTHPNGDKRALDVLYAPLRDEDEIIGVVVSMRDVTFRKENTRQLSTLISNLPGIVYRCKHESGWPMEFVSGECADITGYEASKLESDEVSWGSDIVHPEDRERVSDSVHTAVAAGEPFQLTYRIRTARGEVRWVEERGREVAPLTHDESMLEGVIMDVTERKDRQRQIQIIDRVLRHNLRNDLTVIRGAAEQLRVEDDAPVEEYAGQIIDTSTSLMDTVKKEREITSILIDAPVHQVFELSSTVRGIVDSVSSEYPLATFELQTPDSVCVRATQELGLAIRELVTNALEHSDSDTSTVRIDVVEKDDEVALSITDDGPGIPEMEVNVLTGHEEATPLYHGSGIGLWLVQLIVRQSDGVITFSESEDGSVVTLRLDTDDCE